MKKENLTFGKWFKDVGLKQYSVPFAFILAVCYGYFSNYANMLTANSEIVVILFGLLPVGAFGGMIYHMMDTYKKHKK